MRFSLSAVALSVALGARALARPAVVPSPGVEIRDTSIGAGDTPSPGTLDDFKVKFVLEKGLRAGVEADIAGLGKLLDSGEV